MKLIVGLGNPGKEYEKTRHNAGFMFADSLIVSDDISVAQDFSFNKDLEALIATVHIDGEKVILAKPQTFMNNSGISVAKILRYFKISANDLIVVCDDKDLLVGQARIRNAGSSAGQRGLQNVIDQLKTEDFSRIRIGIAPKNDVKIYDTADFVLDKIGAEDLKLVGEIIQKTIDYVVDNIGKEQTLPAHTIE